MVRNSNCVSTRSSTHMSNTATEWINTVKVLDSFVKGISSSSYHVSNNLRMQEYMHIAYKNELSDFPKI